MVRTSWILMRFLNFEFELVQILDFKRKKSLFRLFVLYGGAWSLLLELIFTVFVQDKSYHTPKKIVF